MNKLTKENSIIELEKRVLHIIMTCKNTFKLQDIIFSFRESCDESITDDEIAEVVLNGLDFCLNTGRVDIYGEFTYMVDPIEQIKYVSQNEANVGVSV